MIKVMHLIDGGFIGGGQIHSLALCRNLNKELFYSVVCASSKGGFKELVLESGFEFIDITLPKLYRSKYLNELLRKVERENVNIVHAHGGVAGMYARFLKKKFGCRAKILHTIHGIHYIHSNNVFRRYSSLYIEQYLAGYSDAYICETESDFHAATNMKIIDPSKSTIINNGINLSRFMNKTKDESVANKLKIANDDFVIGNVSRFDEQKNQKILIRIMPNLIKAIPELKLLLVGDGRLLGSAKRLAMSLGVTDKVIFAGTRKDLEKIYPLMDVFIFPSLWEGLSLSLIEALASGKCIVASNIPSNAEVIINEENGMLFNLHNKNELLELIVSLFNNREKREYLSDNAINSSIMYDEKIMTEKTEQVYLKLMNNN
ncbi:MAG: glycosyltransferase [Ignavibacteria bacterium]